MWTPAIDRGGRTADCCRTTSASPAVVGERMNGKWYGGLYGWTWPHGYYNIGMAATVAGANAFLVTGDDGYLDLPRSQYDIIWSKGELRDADAEEMSLRQHWIDQLSGDSDEIFVVPYRYRDRADGDRPGWFDYQPMSPVYPVAIWNQSADRRGLGPDRGPAPGANNTTGGPSRPFAAKRRAATTNRGCAFWPATIQPIPRPILRAAYATVCRRLALIEQDDQELAQVYIHHWQQLNPIVTEALVQLTLGAPQIIYNGGLLHCRLRYFDLGDGEGRERPGCRKMSPHWSQRWKLSAQWSTWSTSVQ